MAHKLKDLQEAFAVGFCGVFLAEALEVSALAGLFKAEVFAA
ncbi:hypothetical protein W911_14240 [Hyphomicrobium nitrativorans NL23]|uniref:Uncharacterized protein n=1 Tax=Hyphomicrobium nitrativorans NL23 TaxID=1029756 RepID=V5SK29_9HYPH|nr:hypothetical protein [Hyphomicrobium nitrativorans]AHB49869.1 hypothetical protein W911_02860 [Hyphomicrobium nitrativorans NL23]AHB50309.1 hypothetical protein W911_14240 [Hyphomicrobium nitrativorans NL23]